MSPAMYTLLAAAAWLYCLYRLAVHILQTAQLRYRSTSPDKKRCSSRLRKQHQPTHQLQPWPEVIVVTPPTEPTSAKTTTPAAAATVEQAACLCMCHNRGSSTLHNASLTPTTQPQLCQPHLPVLPELGSTICANSAPATPSALAAPAAGAEAEAAAAPPPPPAPAPASASAAGAAPAAPAAAPTPALATPSTAAVACCNAQRVQASVDVWVLAGQSNCVGWNQADGQDMPVAAAPWPDHILCWDSRGCEWKTAVPNVHLGVYGYADANSCGPDMAFARSIICMRAADKVGLVPTACGGTNLFEQWSPGALLWSNMVNDTTAALEALGPAGRLAGIIWIQGESDAFTKETAEAYGNNFTAWLSSTRAALQSHHPCVPVALAVMATRQRSGAFPFIEVVAQQQRELRARNLLKVDMAGYEFFDAGDGSLVHLTKAGCCALGTAIAYEVVAHSERQQQQTSEQM